MFSLRCMIQSEVNGLALFFNVSPNENFGTNEFIQFFIQMLDLQRFLLYNRLAIAISCADTGFDVSSRRGPATLAACRSHTLSDDRSQPVRGGKELSLRHRRLPRAALPQIHENMLLGSALGFKECVTLGLEGLSGGGVSRLHTGLSPRNFQKKVVFAVAVG